MVKNKCLKCDNEKIYAKGLCSKCYMQIYQQIPEHKQAHKVSMKKHKQTEKYKKKIVFLKFWNEIYIYEKIGELK